MRITSAEFLKELRGDDEVLTDALPKIAFIGRSNVGKSSLINALTRSSISRTSPKPGSTQAINVFLINKKFHLIDLPGYGFARGSMGGREKMGNLIASYLFDPKYVQKKVVLIIDAYVGMTERDLGMFDELKSHQKDIVIAASKIDKLKPSEYQRKIAEIQKIAEGFTVFPFSSTEKKGIEEIANELFS
jgi:GTP-binding protein